jgi:hypothetical protein
MYEVWREVSPGQAFYVDDFRRLEGAESAARGLAERERGTRFLLFEEGGEGAIPFQGFVFGEDGKIHEILEDQLRYEVFLSRYEELMRHSGLGVASDAHGSLLVRAVGDPGSVIAQLRGSIPLRTVEEELP